MFPKAYLSSSSNRGTIRIFVFYKGLNFIVFTSSNSFFAYFDFKYRNLVMFRFVFLWLHKYTLLFISLIFSLRLNYGEQLWHKFDKSPNHLCHFFVTNFIKHLKGD